MLNWINYMIINTKQENTRKVSNSDIYQTKECFIPRI